MGSDRLRGISYSPSFIEAMRHETSIDQRTYKDIVNVAIASGSSADKDLLDFCKDTNLTIRKDTDAEVTLRVTDSFGSTIHASINLSK